MADQWKDYYQEKENDREVKENLHMEKEKGKKSWSAKRRRRPSSNLGGGLCSLAQRRLRSTSKQAMNHIGAGAGRVLQVAGERTPM